MRMQAMRAGAVEFLAKPFDDEALLEMFERRWRAKPDKER
jgi:FixJ family two-component response regulator